MFQKGMIKRMLVVAPLSIVSVWEQEFSKFADYEYSLTVLDGGAARWLIMRVLGGWRWS
jgi:SNF2 family DNA or RNA helicase